MPASARWRYRVVSWLRLRQPATERTAQLLSLRRTGGTLTRVNRPIPLRLAPRCYSTPRRVPRGAQRAVGKALDDREREMGGSPIWEELETMELLDIWRQAHLQTALRSNVRNKWIWEHVADQLWHRGFVRSGEQCKNKVHNLLCVYRNVRRGRLPRWRCRYFDVLHRVATVQHPSELEDSAADRPPSPERVVSSEEERRLSPPAAGRERERRAPPALVPIEYRSAPAPVKAAVGLPLTPEELRAAATALSLTPEDTEAADGLVKCSDEARRLLSRLWRHHLSTDLLQGVSDAVSGGPAAGPSRALKTVREAESRSRPYPAVLPSPSRRSTAVGAPLRSPRRSSVSAAPAEQPKSPPGSAELAEDLRGMVVARVPLLPVCREQASWLSPLAAVAVSQPADEPSVQRPSPTGACGSGSSASSTEVLRQLAQRGLLLLPDRSGRPAC